MQWRWLTLTTVAIALSGCSSVNEAAPEGADLTPIVVADLGGESESSLPSAASVTGDVSAVTDARADLDIDDQAGDGSTVVIESVDTNLQAVHIVIETRDGQVLGSDLRTAGLQPVTMRLDQVVPESMELVGRMLADDGDGILEIGIDRTVVDDEGEQVAEDFDYVLTQDATKR